MQDQELRQALTEINSSGSNGLSIPKGMDATQRALVSMDYAYVPLNPFAAFGVRETIRLTTRGRKWLRENPEPMPAPDPVPEPAPPEPAALPDPEPLPEPEPDPPAPVDPPVGPVPDPTAPIPEPAPGPHPEHAAFVAQVKAIATTAVDMPTMAAQLNAVATQAMIDGIVPHKPGGRTQLPLTRRNATKWASDPFKYGLAGVIQ